MTTVAVRKTQTIARPLKVLVPLIKGELAAADEAGLGHYRRAGQMLLEAREQLSGGSWTSWLRNNFDLGKDMARRYMRLAEHVAQGRVNIDDEDRRAGAPLPLYKAIGERHTRTPLLSDWMPRAKVDHLAQERQTREDEVRMHRELALELIEIGFKALATRLHPDKGGSKDAMARLNRVRHELRDVAATRRFA